ncbi:MAG: hypothetical protein IKX23_01290 [Treponema sp.]|nr:hypothetical protein [Treponema sp.]
MKRILCTILILFSCASLFFAEENQGDEYDDGYVYEQNGAGDQFLKITINGLFPLNFEKQLKTGGSIELGYYRFLNKFLALGGELELSYNVSIGEKLLVMIPFTLGVLYQPTYNKFEFPIYLTAGIGYETFQSIDYFPSFVMKLNPGAFYRLNEICSFGVTTTLLWVPQWYEDSSHNQNGFFLSAGIGARYHF